MVALSTRSGMVYKLKAIHVPNAHFSFFHPIPSGYHLAVVGVQPKIGQFGPHLTLVFPTTDDQPQTAPL